MKKIIIITLMIISAFSLKGQRITAMDFDPTPFLGKWTATSNGITYELTMIRDTIFMNELFPDLDFALDQINCHIIYKQGNTILRTIEPTGPRPILSGVPSDENLLEMRFDDTERKIVGYVDFKLDPANPNKASWELTKRGLYMPREGGAEDFDIPRHLTFRKSLDLDPGKPGGGTGITNP